MVSAGSTYVPSATSLPKHSSGYSQATSGIARLRSLSTSLAARALMMRRQHSLTICNKQMTWELPANFLLTRQLHLILATHDRPRSSAMTPPMEQISASPSMSSPALWRSTRTLSREANVAVMQRCRKATLHELITSAFSRCWYRLTKSRACSSAPTPR